nr:tsukushin-like [Onthophagus taurus]
MFNLLLLSVLFLLIYSANGLLNLCGLTKSDNKCLCEYKTNKLTNFPELSANCRWIELDRFPDMTSFPDDLSTLDLLHNNIKKLDDTTTTEALKTLDVSYNEINYIEYGFFQNFPSLESLNLSHNLLTALKQDAFSDLKQLKYLDLSFNQFSQLPDGLFIKLNQLKSLNLGYNPLGQFFEEKKLFFDPNLGISKNITHLNVDYLGLDKVGDNFFDGGDKIIYFTAADNHFDVIPSLPSNLEYLDFSGNNLTKITVSHLTYDQLKVLKLNRLFNLNEIDKYGFYNLQKLEELYLENCPKLKEFNPIAFGLMGENEKLNLKKLVLARSGIQKLNSTYYHLFRKLDFIDLQNNNFICDCDILWLQLLNGSYYKQENMRCMAPTNIRNVKIMLLEERHLPMCLMSTQSIKLQKILIPILAIAILLLLCLIVYLLYMGPYMYRNYRGIGPDSPYQHTVLRDMN